MNTTRVHLAFSALMGATGVVLLAAATHGGGIANVQTAGNFLLFHAPAIMAATMARRAMLLPLRMGAVTIWHCAGLPISARFPWPLRWAAR
jgi:uncharacterized membrane protein YgdD (TMEM256/DUF423 family)